MALKLGSDRAGGARALSCSVIIVSRRGPDRLVSVLRSLALQRTDEPFEVIVVLDGNLGGSQEVLEGWAEIEAFASFKWFKHASKGLAASRNRGAFVAQAPILLFLDEDVVPGPDLVSSHVRRHRSASRIAVLGCVDPIRTEPSTYLRSRVWTDLEAANDRRASIGQPLGFRDFATVSISVRKDDFAGVGGYDHQYEGTGGDEDLGYRLRKGDVRFICAPEIRSARELTETARTLHQATIARAHGDVRLARKYPELIAGLRLGKTEGRRARRAAGLAMFAPWLGFLAVLARRGLMVAYERLGLRGRWQRSLDFLVTYAYWRGLKGTLGSLKAVRALRTYAEESSKPRIEITEALAPQLEAMSFDTKIRLTIAYAGEPVGSCELDPESPEPLLPRLVHEISSNPPVLLLMRLFGGTPGAEFGELLLKGSSLDRG